MSSHEMGENEEVDNFQFVVKYKDKKPQQQSIILLILATNYCNILFRQTRHYHRSSVSSQ